ncbi:MAG: hypothetical protein ABRQ37_01680 [Candidatus Eremiobacterota bacterium]
MKKYVITGFSGLILIYLFILISGCGGGSSTVNPGTQPTSIDTPTTNPVFTPTNTPITDNTPTPTSTLPPGVTPTNTPVGNTPTPTNTPNNSKNVSINVKDLFDSSNKSGLQVYFNDTPVTNTDASGNANFNITANGRMKLTGNSIERSLPVYTTTLNYNVSVLPNGYNTTFLRALWGNYQIREWISKPKFVIYKYLLNSSPAVAVSQSTIDNVKSIINTELPTLANGYFGSPGIEEFNGRPNDDPRFNVMDAEFGTIQTNGYISIAFVADINGGSASTYNYANTITLFYAGSVFEPSPTLTTIRHEMGHACFGWEHPFDFVTGALLELSVMNYSSTGKRTDGFSPKDIEASKFWVSRPRGNNTPDYDPDGSTLKTSSEPAGLHKFKIHK